MLSTCEKELLALVMAIQKWRHYLVGQHFKVRIDQQALKYLLEQRIGTPAQQKWTSKLLGYDFSMEYKSGKTNKVADALSRVTQTEKPDPKDYPKNTQSSHRIHQTTIPTPNNQPIIPQTNLQQSILHKNQQPEPQVQAISIIQTEWLQELKKIYPQDPQLQELFNNYHQGILDQTQYQICKNLLFFKGKLHLGSLVSFQQGILQ